VLIPVATDYLAVDSLDKTLGMLTRFVQQGWSGQLAGILPTMHDTVTRESRNAMEYLTKQYAGKLLDPIRRATVLRECSSDGKTIWEKASQTPVAGDFQKLIREVAKQ
jgi:chromosome partitioning protein